LKEETDCERGDCVVHAFGGKGNCNKEGAVYQGDCKTCAEKGVKSIYIGETSRSTYVRGQQHLKAMQNPVQSKNKNAFAKHIIEKHGDGEKVKFGFKIVKNFAKPLERQVREGVEILGMRADVVMNSKLDHYKPAIRRVGFTDILDELELDLNLN